MSTSITPSKRKASADYSTNTNTVKSAKRREGLDVRNKEWEDAKQKDRKAITYRYKKVEDSEEYKTANEEQKQKMLDKAKAEVMTGRYMLY